MNDIKLKQKFSPGILEYGFFPFNFEILKNSRISIQYVYFAMFALWNEFEFLMHRELIQYYMGSKPISDEKVRKLTKGERSIREKFNPLIVKFGEKLKKERNILRKVKLK